MNKCPKCNRNMLSDDTSGREYCVKCDPKEAQEVYEKEVIEEVTATGDGVTEVAMVVRTRLSEIEYKGWLKGNAIECVLSARDDMEIWKKARWYIDRLY